MLYAKGRINNYTGVTSSAYIQDILIGMGIEVQPITASIAELAQSPQFQHGDPADRLIAATAISLNAPLITADEKLRALPDLKCIW